MKEMALDVISLSVYDEGFWAHHFKLYGPLPHRPEKLGPTTLPLSFFKNPRHSKWLVNYPKQPRASGTKPHEMGGYLGHFYSKDSPL